MAKVRTAVSRIITLVGDVDVELKFSVQQVAGSDQDCADSEVDEDGDQGAVVGFYGSGFVFPV